MKKNYTRILMTAVTLMVSGMANAYDFEDGNLFYNHLPENECEVTYKYLDYNNPYYSGTYIISSSAVCNGVSRKVTAIGDKAFSETKGVTSVTIPNGVTRIGESAFYCCTGLTSITLPSTVTSIGKYAFSGSAITSFTIPNGVAAIEDGMFTACLYLKSVTIPASVKSIGFVAFGYCSKLTSVTDYATTPQTLDENVFESIASDATLHVLPGCKAAYEAANWDEYFNIVEDAAAPTGIEAVQNTQTKVNSSAAYNLSGQHVSANAKGLVIINGKKYFQK